MTEKLEIRDSVPGDLCAIESLYPKAFPDEDLLPLVRDLLQETTVTTSIVGVIDSRIVGHVIFTKCGVAGNRTDVALLGPLAVAPAWQGQGIGSAIVRAGFKRLEDEIVARTGVGLDRGFDMEPVVLSRSQADVEVGSMLGTEQGSREGVIYDNQAQFRFYARWRYLVARAEWRSRSDAG